MSCWWRVFSSSWAKNHQIKLWAEQFLHPQVCHGKGAAGAEVLMESLQDVLTAYPGGCVTSLDWSHAFDSMDPAITSEVLKKIKMVPQLAELLSVVWGHQTRFIQFDGATHNQELFAGQAMPQGDPLSPLCLAVWVSAGLRYASDPSRLPENARTTAVCYMDDRTFWSSNLQCALTQVTLWNQWSRIVGLTESQHKTQIMVRSPEDEFFLKLHHPTWLVSEVTALGVSTTSSRRTATPHEEQRIAKAQSRAGILSVAPLVWPLKIRAFQSLVVSKAAYGWCGNDPTNKHADVLFNLLTRWMNTGKQASKELRNMFYGTVCWLPWVVLTRRWSRLRKRLRIEADAITWQTRPFTALNKFHKGLKALGFELRGPWQWKPKSAFQTCFSGEECCLDLRSEQPPNLQLHIILRRTMKIQAFISFTRQARRDSVEIRESLTFPQQLRAFADIDLTLARKFLDSNGECRAFFWGGVSCRLLHYTMVRESKSLTPWKMLVLIVLLRLVPMITYFGVVP